MIECLSVGLGGALGAVLRYLVGLAPLPGQGGFPLATLAVNVLGAFAIGGITAAAAKNPAASPALVLFLRTGLCGGFTTFSTFSLESHQLLSAGKTGAAACYMLLSLGLCLAAVWAGGRLAA